MALSSDELVKLDAAARAAADERAARAVATYPSGRKTHKPRADRRWRCLVCSQVMPGGPLAYHQQTRQHFGKVDVADELAELL